MMAIHRFSQFLFDLIIVLNIVTEQKGKRYRGNRAIEAFEEADTRSDFKCCDY